MNPAPLKIRIYGDLHLRTKCTSVKNIGPGERMIIQSMIATMHQAKGVGLAAPQVGIDRRFFVLDVGEGPLAIINPRIIKRSGSETVEEGCLSIPDVTVMVKRPEQITLQYMDENNQMMKMTCNDLLARVIQHETDHLDGKLIVDYATDSEKEKFKDQLALLESGRKEQV